MWLVNQIPGELQWHCRSELAHEMKEKKENAIHIDNLMMSVWFTFQRRHDAECDGWRSPSKIKLTNTPCLFAQQSCNTCRKIGMSCCKCLTKWKRQRRRKKKAVTTGTIYKLTPIRKTCLLAIRTKIKKKQKASAIARLHTVSLTKAHFTELL